MERNAGTPQQMNFDWTKGVWKLHVAPKIKLFLWKTFQGALPVGERLAARNIAVDTKCKRCGQTESIHHLFFQCEFAKRVWDFAPFTSPMDSSGLIDLAINWLNLVDLKCLPPTGIPSEGLTPWIMWSIWIARNNLLFNQKASSPEDVISRAISSAREWLEAQEPPTKGQGQHVEVELPLTNCYKVQTDAAWREELRGAGLGWTITKNAERSDFGAHCFYVSSPLIAEALALREALCKCKELNLQRFICETDSTQLIQAIKTRKPPPEIYGVLSDIFKLIPCFAVIRFKWIPRSKNKEADALAKHALLAASNVMNSTRLGL